MSLKKNKEATVLQADIEKLKNELSQEHDIESLVRHIVLTNRRLFAILVCESPIQAKAAAEVLEKSASEMEGKQIPFLHFAFKRKKEEPATFKELVPQILEPLFYWDDTDKEKKVFLIDASDAQEQDQEGWIILFQRMNEVRNTLMNRLPGPLILILTHVLAIEFPRRVPDFWSIRSEFAEAKANLKPLEPLERYKKKMKADYGTLQIWKMDKPASLEGIYTRMNMLDKPSAFCHAAIEELQKEFQGEISEKFTEKEIDGLKAVQENQQLFILGKPGAGKTTFLKYVTLKAIDGELGYIPIFISLRSFSESGLNLSDFIAKEFERFDFPDAQSFIEAILNEGKAILLCDGLDEVNKENELRDSIVKELNEFNEKYKSCKFIVTCRTAVPEYQQFKDFVYVEMADFDDKQIKTFVYKWFTGESNIADNFLREFEGIRNKQFKELAKNPLLLTLLCISFHETLSFPSRRSEIYEEASDALLRKWDTFKRIKWDEIYKNLSLGRKRQMFARIAYESFEKGEYLFEEKKLAEKVADYLKGLPQTDIKEKIDGVSVIKAIEAQHGIFIERAEGIYSFVHLTFQEYYTAKYIVANIQKGMLKRLTENHLFDESWREVFLLTAEMLDDADEFFEIFLKALDAFVKKDERLIKFLEKIEEKAKKADIKAKLFEIRGGVVYVIRLLVDCLEVAYVSDREAIEERLLVPPKDMT